MLMAGRKTDHGWEGSRSQLGVWAATALMVCDGCTQKLPVDGSISEQEG